MTTAEVLAVHRATVEQPCRRCDQPIQRGQRVVLLAAIGGVHLRCILAQRGDAHRNETAPAPAPDQSAPSPTRLRPETPIAAEDTEPDDPRSIPWYDRT
jgi:hypothetical protein